MPSGDTTVRMTATTIGQMTKVQAKAQVLGQRFV
jgi:hypothetical protein